jgi:transcriptional regulator with XRE-family HTH domain
VPCSHGASGDAARSRRVSDPALPTQRTADAAPNDRRAADEAARMTPFGARLRALREARGVTLAELAAALQVSAAYLSALEHGHRGRPSAGLVHQVNEFFGLIWDEAEELARLARESHPRPSLDSSGLAPEATALANRLAREFRTLTPEQIARIAAVLDEG